MPARKTLYKVYGKIQRLIVPSLKFCHQVYEEVLDTNVYEGIRWLDLGCGHQLLPSWRFQQETRLIGRAAMAVGIDADWHSLERHRSIRARVRGNIAALPFQKHSFDLITANMVVEHLDRPAQQFAEINRILRPGGLFIFHTPNALGYSTVLGRLLPERAKLFLIRVLEGRPA